MLVYGIETVYKSSSNYVTYNFHITLMLTETCSYIFYLIYQIPTFSNVTVLSFNYRYQKVINKFANPFGDRVTLRNFVLHGSNSFTVIVCCFFP